MRNYVEYGGKNMDLMTIKDNINWLVLFGQRQQLMRVPLARQN